MIDFSCKLANDWEAMLWQGTKEPEHPALKFEKIDLLKEKIVQEILDVIFLHASYTDQETFI